VIRIGARPPPSYEDPVAVLEHHHANCRAELAVLAECSAALAAERDVDTALAGASAALAFFEGPGTRHREDEEFSVLPRIVNDETRAALDDLATDHRVHEAMLLAIRSVVGHLRTDLTLAARLGEDLLAHAVALRQALEEHFEAEERLLVPMTRALSAPELRAIGIEMRLRRGGQEPR